MKDTPKSSFFSDGKWHKYLSIKIFLLLCCVSQMPASGSAFEQVKFNLKFENTAILQVLDYIKTETGYTFVYKQDELSSRNKVSVYLTDATLHETLDKVLVKSGYNYSIEGKVIVVTKQPSTRQGGDPQPSQQVKQITVTGRVLDEKGNTLIGAAVVINQTTRGVTTDIKGEYSIQARVDDVLKVSYIGYIEQVIPIQGKEKIVIQLKPTEKTLDDVVVVAFGSQKKESIVSSITTVRPKDLKTSSSDLTTSFAGRIPGMIAWQTGGLPGALTEGELNTKYYIRGITSFQSNANSDPLILIDGVESSKLELSRLAPEDIDSFSVLKDASATAMYGARGANGVIVIETKKGEEGSVYTTARYEFIVSQPTEKIDVVDPITYMKMYNQALSGRSNTGEPKYSTEYINRTASGKYPSWVYPQNDWYKILFKDVSINHHAGISIRGGSKVIQYYASVNYNRDEGMLKNDKLNDFDTNITNNQINFRTNLNINLNSGIRLVINSATNLDKYNGSLVDQRTAYQAAFFASPVDFAPVYPADDTYSWPHIRFGTTANEGVNPYMMNQQGYSDRTRFSATNRAEYIHNLSSLVKGLEVRASASFVHISNYDNVFTTKPFRYFLDDYNPETGKHILAPVKNDESDRTLSVGNGTKTSEDRITYEGRVYHNAAWSDHQTSFTGIFQAYERTISSFRSVLQGLPQRNLTYSGRMSYGYKDRYFLESSVGYNGSERFAKKNRMGLFPSVGAAWVASSEKWMQPISKYLSYLKVRGSWGKVGNDGIINEPRYVYLETLGEGEAIYNLEPYTQGNFNPKKVIFYGDENIQWEIAEQLNFGIETKLYGGLLELQADVYQEIRHNIISNRYIIPASMGLESFPLANIGKTRSRGVDLSLKLQHQFSPDFWIILNNTLTYNKVIYKEFEEASGKPTWQHKKGMEISQAIGYIAEGLFRDQAEIDNSPRQDGDVMPGDIKYRDINRDGVIDVSDAVPIGYPETPRLIYGLNGNINYKNLEFSYAFQGSGKRTFFIDPVQISPFAGDHALLTAIYKDHWSADNMSDKPFWPRLSTNNIAIHNPQERRESSVEERKSTYFMRECSFLRCTSLSLAYSMPRKLIRKWDLQDMKFYVSANNPFLITDFKLWDVELGGNGFNYPIQKSYTVGLSVNF